MEDYQGSACISLCSGAKATAMLACAPDCAREGVNKVPPVPPSAGFCSTSRPGRWSASPCRSDWASISEPALSTWLAPGLLSPPCSGQPPRTPALRRAAAGGGHSGAAAGALSHLLIPVFCNLPEAFGSPKPDRERSGSWRRDRSTQQRFRVQLGSPDSPNPSHIAILCLLLRTDSAKPKPRAPIHQFRYSSPAARGLQVRRHRAGV